MKARPMDLTMFASETPVRIVATSSLLLALVSIPLNVAAQEDSIPTTSTRVADLGPAGTAVMIPGPVDPWGLTDVNGTLFFVAREGDGVLARLWRTDGTNEGTRPIESCRTALVCGAPRPPRRLVGTDDLLYFVTTDGLWRSDGTSAGTFMVAKDADVRNHKRSAVSARIERDRRLAERYRLHDDVCGANSSGTLLYVVATRECLPPYPRQLWVSDGTREGTHRIARDVYDDGRGYLIDFTSTSAGISEARVFGAYDRAHGLEPWVTDGTPKGTRRLRDVRPGKRGGMSGQALAAGSLAYFVANDGIHGSEPWVTDGTRRGTRMLRDVRPGKRSGIGSGLIAIDDLAFFIANDGVHGREPWVSDGTSEGTRLISDIRPGNRDGIPRNAEGPVASGGVVYMIADDDVHGSQLWRTDGTADGTRTLTDLPRGSSGYFEVRDLEGLALIIIHDQAGGASLWSSDGSAADTNRLRELCALGEDGSCEVGFHGAVESNGLLYFDTDDGSRGGYRVWRTDGTADGTFTLDNGQEGPIHRTDFDEFPAQDFEGSLYFLAAGDTRGTSQNLWRTDGTQDGTVIASRRGPVSFLATGSGLYFVAGNSSSDQEPCWNSRCHLWYLPAETGTVPEDIVPPERSGTLASSRSVSAKDVVAGFPEVVAGRDLNVEVFDGSTWLSSHDPTDTDDAAAMAAIKGFVAGLDRTPEDLIVAYALTRARGRPVTITAVSVDGVKRGPLIDAIIPFLFADTVDPARERVKIAGRRVIRVKDAAIPGSYPRYIYPLGDVAWLIEANKPVLSEILKALP